MLLHGRKMEDVTPASDPKGELLGRGTSPLQLRVLLPPP